MEERPPATAKPPRPLQKPPGYKDPAAPAPAVRPPPRKQTLPTTFHPRGTNPPKHDQRRRRHRHCCRRLCCWLCLIVLVLFFALALAGALTYLWFQPKLPSFHLESIQTPQFAVAVKPDGSFLDARTVVRLQVANPNDKIRLSYAPSEARVVAPGDDDSGDVTLGSGSFQGFDQGKKNSTVLRFEARVKGVMVGDGVGARLGDRYRSKSLRIVVEVRTRVGVVAGGKRSGKVPMRVVCGDVSLKQLQGGGSAPKCSINLLKWIRIHH